MLGFAIVPSAAYVLVGSRETHFAPKQAMISFPGNSFCTQTGSSSFVVDRVIFRGKTNERRFLKSNSVATNIRFTISASRLLEVPQISELCLKFACCSSAQDDQAATKRVKETTAEGTIGVNTGEDWLRDPLVKYYKDQFEKATSAEEKRICAEQLSAAYKEARMSNVTSGKSNDAGSDDDKAITLAGLQLFWKELRNAEEIVIDAGSGASIISLPTDMRWPGSPLKGNLFVRSYYRQLFELLHASYVRCTQDPQHKAKDWVVTGNPGIGKTLFSLYCLYRFSRLESPPPIVIHYKLARRSALFLKDDVQLLRLDDSQMEAALSRSDCVYLVDSEIEPVQCNAFTIFTTSPNRERYKEFLKQGTAQKVFMPPWRLEEFTLCRPNCFPSVSEDRMLHLLEIIGPIPRYVLDKAHQEDELCLGDLMEALDSCNLADVVLSSIDLERRELMTGVSHRVLIYDLPQLDEGNNSKEGINSKDITRWVKPTIRFASEYIEREVRRRLREQDEHGLFVQLDRRPVQTISVTVGNLFEGALLDLLGEGREVRGPLRLAGSNKSEEHTLLTQQTVTFWSPKDLCLLDKGDGVLLRPQKRTAAGYDAFITPNRFLQLTIQDERHAEVTREMLEVCDALGVSIEDCELLFIVPEYNFEKFKAKARLSKGTGMVEGKGAKKGNNLKEGKGCVNKGGVQIAVSTKVLGVCLSDHALGARKG